MKRLVILGFMAISLLNGMSNHDDSMKVPISYRRAIKDDIPSLLYLIDNFAAKASNKLVILPKRFRETALEDAIDQGHLFVACLNDQIIGYKKLFLIKDKTQKNDILQNELRLFGLQSKTTYRGSIDAKDLFLPNQLIVPEYEKAACIYTGADFTLDDYRGTGINKRLTDIAFSTIKPQVVEELLNSRVSIITLLYGLTQANAGDEVGKSPDRTRSINTSFKDFIATFSQPRDQLVLKHARCEAYKPSFDPDSLECKPLPDNQSIAGYGCALSYQLR